MGICELCGREENLVGAFVEGVSFKVCLSCSKFGKVVDDKIVKKFERTINRTEESFEVVDDDCGVYLKEFRAFNGLSQHDLALKVNEKESILSKIEQGSIKPSIELAKKLEKLLGKTLVTKEKISEALSTKVEKNALTIGDFVKKESE